MRKSLPAAWAEWLDTEGQIYDKGERAAAFVAFNAAWNLLASDRPSDEREALRAGQAKAVMPLIGPLLDAVEGIPNDLRDELVDVLRISGQINTAMEQAAPVAVPPLTDEQIVNTLAEHGIGELWHAGLSPFPLDGEDAPLFIAAYRALLSRTVPAHHPTTDGEQK